MKKLLFGCIVIFVLSCSKDPETPQLKCGFITGKYLYNNVTPTFMIDDLSGYTITVSQSVYDSYKIGDKYCH